jgi:lactoylglutathione lyase
MAQRPFRILGLQQIAVGGTDKARLRTLWVDTLGLAATGTYRSAHEDVRSEERRAGKERMRPCRARWSTDH